MTLIQVKQENRTDRILVTVAEDELRIEEAERKQLQQQPYLLVYIIHGQCCRKGGRLSKVSGSRLEQTLAVIYHAACIKELKARGFTVEVVIDAWCELNNPEQILR